MNISQFIALPVGRHLGCVITNNTDTNVLLHVFYCCIPKNELLDIFDVLITGNFVYMPLVFYFELFIMENFKYTQRLEQ